LNIARIEFAAEELPGEALACSTVRDEALLFVWNRSQVLQALPTLGLDGLLDVVNELVNEALTANTPWHVALRSVG
jgi:hypothetical protein